MIGRAQHHHRATLRQFDNQIGGPGDAVGMNNDRGNIVQCHAPDFITIQGDDQQSAMRREVHLVRRDIDNPVHA